MVPGAIVLSTACAAGLRGIAVDLEADDGMFGIGFESVEAEDDFSGFGELDGVGDEVGEYLS